MIRTSVYLDDFMDEGCPSDLIGWANFLSGQSFHSEDQGNKPRAKDDDSFAATTVQWHYIPTPRKEDGTYDLPDCPDGFDYHAVAFGPGMGWNGDLMVSCRGDELVRRLLAEDLDATPEEDWEDSRQQLAKVLAEFGDQPVEWVVLRGKESSARVIFHDHPPRCVWVDLA